MCTLTEEEEEMILLRYFICSCVYVFLYKKGFQSINTPPMMIDIDTWLF